MEYFTPRTRRRNGAAFTNSTFLETARATNSEAPPPSALTSDLRENVQPPTTVTSGGRIKFRLKDASRLIALRLPALAELSSKWSDEETIKSPPESALARSSPWTEMSGEA